MECFNFLADIFNWILNVIRILVDSAILGFYAAFELISSFFCSSDESDQGKSSSVLPAIIGALVGSISSYYFAWTLGQQSKNSLEIERLKKAISSTEKLVIYVNHVLSVFYAIRSKSLEDIIKAYQVERQSLVTFDKADRAGSWPKIHLDLEKIAVADIDVEM